MLLAGSGEAAQKVLALQSVQVSPYEEALRGVRNVLGSGVKKLVLSELEGVDIAKVVREERPDVIVAIGAEALARVRKIKDTPIVYLMVLDPQNTLTNGENITGVNLYVSPERQLTSLQGVVPHLKKVGLLYNPSLSGPLVRKAQTAARGLGIDLIAREVRSPREVLSMTGAMKGEVDAFWMLPDKTVVTAETAEFLLLFSLNNKIPILTFSDKYVEMGALMALEANPFDLGRQAGEMSRKILSGVSVGSIPRTDPRSSVMTINGKIARKLGISLGEEVLGRAKVIR